MTARSNPAAMLAMFPIELPGRAGELQRKEAWGELAVELGANYLKYHQFLSEKLAGLEQHPDPGEYRQKYGEERAFEEYAAAASSYQQVLIAEQRLRWVLARYGPDVERYRQEGPNDLGPLVNTDGTLAQAGGSMPTVEDPPRTDSRAPDNLRKSWPTPLP